MAKLVPYSIKTHKQKVLSLYKRAIRNLDSWFPHRPAFRYHAVVMRARFDENKNLKDEVRVSQIMVNAEKELADHMHYQPKQFANSIGGTAYGREAFIPDWVLDGWHPLEKAQYPEYFKRREQRKLEYIKMWERQYGPSSSSESSHH